MEFLFVSFIAGILTVLAPCILPLLPIIVGGSLDAQKQPLKPFTITASLAISIFIFTLLLRASTTLLSVPVQVWQFASGTIILLLGVTLLLPAFWERHAAALNASSSKLLSKAGRAHGLWRDIATGAALGPVFSSCSPTYAFILAAVLPGSWLEGVANVSAYAVGLAITLLTIAIFGQQLISKLGWASNPQGWFKRSIALLFVIVGICVLFGFDKDIQAFVISQGWYAPIEHIERSLR